MQTYNIQQNTVLDIRKTFINLYNTQTFTLNKNKTGSKTIEIIGASFYANEDTIFGDINYEWVKREIAWYHTHSLNVNDIPGGPPAIWKQVSSISGNINSNYGNLVFSDDNYSQFDKCALQLEDDCSSRRAIMIYTRPSIQNEYCTDGMSDFICTNTVQYFIRDDTLITYVCMRSCDAVFGYKNDLQWQKEVREILLTRLKISYPLLQNGPIIWNCGSLHVYEKHFHLVK